MLLESESIRQKRFKAMMQYSILHEAYNFDNKFLSVDAEEQPKEKDNFKKESAKKILAEMELKFYDFFVDDDLGFNPFQSDNKKEEIQKKIEEEIQKNSNFSPEDKEKLKIIFASNKIENLIITDNLDANYNSHEINAHLNDDKKIIEAVEKIFVKEDLISNINILSAEARDEEEWLKTSFKAIDASIKTATALSFGFINLTGKNISRAVSGLFDIFENSSPSKYQENVPEKSVSGKKTLDILLNLDASTQQVKV